MEYTKPTLWTYALPRILIYIHNYSCTDYYHAHHMTLQELLSLLITSSLDISD